MSVVDVVAVLTDSAITAVILFCLMSGTLGKPTKRIKCSFESRYYVNFFDNLFEDLAITSLLTKRDRAYCNT